MNISKVNLAEIITAEDDPEEIFEILDYLGKNDFLFRIKSNQKIVFQDKGRTDKFTRHFIKKREN